MKPLIRMIRNLSLLLLLRENSAGNYDTEIAVTAGEPSGAKLKVEPEDKDNAFTITEADTKERGNDSPGWHSGRKDRTQCIGKSGRDGNV